MLFGPPMLGLLADFTKVRWAFVADSAALLATAVVFAAVAGESHRGLYLPPAAAAAAAAAAAVVAATDGRRSADSGSDPSVQRKTQIQSVAALRSVPGNAAETLQHDMTAEPANQQRFQGLDTSELT
jgi:uncharacterized membrane protein (DUF4010 family)